MVGETEGARTETGNKEGKTSTVTSHLHSPATHTHTHARTSTNTHTHTLTEEKWAALQKKKEKLFP